MSGPRRNIDIAIIGLSCRFPGAASADEYWKNLCDGVESITFFSDDELLAAGADRSLVANPNYVKAAPILRDVEMFDASFFGYSPKDAALMDPQQRLFLEVCWEAFENAGYDPTEYPGKVGVVSTAGGLVTSYLVAKMHHAEFPGQTASTAHINNDKDFLSTRVSFKLNLKGPSYTIQSACSSSLVAVHQACQHLRFDECDAMLAGGSAVRVPQVEGYVAEKRNVYSLDGHCRPFDATGQGTIFGSGVGAVLLKPLEKALADGDNIVAVIKGTAINNDGSAKISYTAPSVGQQSQAVADALAFAGIGADSVGYVECHSTGTAIGDPLEIEALATAFRRDTNRTQYCAVGSMKGNIGHPEQASGIAGLIKAALVLHHKRIPPSINYETPNSRIDFPASPFYVNTELREFPHTETPRRAGLNSLGIGGTNAFAVLEEAPPNGTVNAHSSDRFPCLVTLSAKDAGALIVRVEQLLNWLNDNPGASIGDLCYTTNVSRSQFAFRFAASARSVEELKNHLAARLRTAGDGASAVQRTRGGPIAFMFSGQGSQHAGMAAELYRTHSVFRNAMDRCQALARPHLEQDLLEVIFASCSEAALVNRTDYTQPALFAVGYALAELLKSWGIVPAAVIGHSLGEITGACVAGAISLEDAMRLVVARGALMQRMPSGGAMASIWAGESAVRDIIEKLGADVTIAGLNSPSNTVVSGDREPLKLLLEELTRQNIVCQELRVSNSFHSQRSDPILDEFENVAGQLEYKAPRVPFISNLTGERMTIAPDKTYWRRHLREAVRFADGMLALSKFECRTFVEIGAHPVLLPPAQVCLGASGKSASWVASLDRQKSDADAISAMLVALYLAGHKINWSAVHADAPRRRIPLPTYPFQRQRHWIGDRTAPSDRSRSTAEPASHPLVGTLVEGSAKEARYEARYGTEHINYFSDHRISGTVVLPTTAELEAATVLGRMHFGTHQVSFENAMHHRAMSFSNSEERIVRLVVTPLRSDKANFRLLSAGRGDADVWQTHMTGILRRSQAQAPAAFSLRDVQTRCQRTIPIADFYDRLHGLGLEYGPSFRGVRELYIGEREVLAKVQLPQHLAAARYTLHPAFLDACLHAYPALLYGADNTERLADSSYLPVSLTAFRCYRDGVEEAWTHITHRGVEKDGTQVIDVRVYDVAERLVAELEGLALRELSLDTVLPSRAMDHLFYRVAWRKSVRGPARSGKESDPKSWIIFADAKGTGDALARKLEASGHHCHLVYAGDTFARQATRRWTVNERQREHFARLLAEFAATETLPCEGVLYLWSLDAPPMEDLTLASLKDSSERMCRGALGILHALTETRSKNRTGRRLWFVTANTQKTDDGACSVDPVQAPLWGLGRTIAIEHPGIWGGLIDLQLNEDTTPDMDLLAAEFLDPDGENQIVISADRQRAIPRFVRQTLAELPAQVPTVRSDATYLVTGGLGMLGRSVARWLIAKGAKHLVLTGRNASAEAAEQIFSAAERGAAQLHIVAADISREEDVRHLFQKISKELPPLKGVVHSSGILDDGILARLDWDRFARLFAVKVYGSWLLHEYTKSLELDFFVLKSSLLSLLGSAGQANYTAGGAFLDSLAAHRRADELPALAINWCAWSEGGLATLSGARGEAMWSSLGHRFIAPDLAMTVFDKLMHRDVEQIAIADADWPTYTAKVGEPLFLSELVSGDDASAPANLAQQSGSDIRIDEQSRQQMLRRLMDRVQETLGFAEGIDPDQRLNEIGLDSLMSVSLSNAIEEEFGISVPIADLISGPSINQLANSIFGNPIATSSSESESGAANWALGDVGKPIVRIPANDGHSVSPPWADQFHSGTGTPRPSRSGLASMDAPPIPVRQHNGLARFGSVNGGRRATIELMLQRHIMAELGFADPIDPDRPLNELGLDSLRAVKVSINLENDLGIPVSASELIWGPTINQLADHLIGELAGQERGESEQADEDIIENPSAAKRTAEHVAVPHPLGADVGVALEWYQGERVSPKAFGWKATATAIEASGSQIDLNSRATGEPGEAILAARGSNGGAAQSFDASVLRRPNTAALRTTGKWLIAPRPNSDAKCRLFCFPYAGGGLVSFRSWPQLLGDSVEVVAVEPPGRGTRINESAVDDMDRFVDGLLSEMVAWVDRPSAFFGHCLGGLTMFATLRALPKTRVPFIKHAFACGIRPPHLLKFKGKFEDNLLYDMMLHRDFDADLPPFAQADEILADIIRQFNLPAADRMLEIPKLRKLLLPTVRAEFGMAYQYKYQPGEPFSFPISSFVGSSDPWVSEQDSAGWGTLTSGKFTNYLRDGSHFLMADDREYILQTIEREFVASVSG